MDRPSRSTERRRCWSRRLVLRALAAGFVASTLVGCSSHSTSPPSSSSSPASSTVEPDTGQATVSDDGLGDLSDAAASAATDIPQLLVIVNRTGGTAVLTSADGKNTVTVAAGKSVQLASARACGWLPLTASTEDGTMIDQYTQRCDGGTWTIRDPAQHGAGPGDR